MKTKLINCLSVQSHYYNEVQMKVFITDQLNQIKGIKWTQDAIGNIIASKGEGVKPCFACHMDTVHEISENFIITCSTDGVLKANDGIKNLGIGGDDKCGIFICIELLETLDNVKVVFFTQEENKRIGSKDIDLIIFDDCAFVMQFDRKGNSDFINSACSIELCDAEFGNTIIEKFDYHRTNGFGTDVVSLKERGLIINCCNVSSGYYNQHTQDEFVVEKDVYKALEMGKEFAAMYGHNKQMHQ